MDVSDKAMTLRAQEHGHQPVVCYGLEPGIPREGCDGADDRHYFTRQSNSEFIQGVAASTLKERDYKDFTDVVVENKPPRKYIVRRLMPVEAARLQGFPDWWCDEADGSDSAQYKLWGNGIALPCAVDVLGRIAKEANRCD